MKPLKHTLLTMRLLPAIIPAILFASTLLGCSDDKRETIEISADPETFPTMKTLNVSTLISDSGYTRYHITTPIWLMFEEAADPHWRFPQGIYLVQYDNMMKETGTFTADTATYMSAKKLWRFDRNVRMKNTAGDRFLTQQLFWDQNSQKLRSDSFIHIERADRIIEGYGFESDQEMKSYIIFKPTGIFPTGDFVSGANNRNQPPPPSSTPPDSL